MGVVYRNAFRYCYAYRRTTLPQTGGAETFETSSIANFSVGGPYLRIQAGDPG